MATVAEEDVPYCSPGSPSRKQKEAHSTSLPQIRTENTLATIKADQALLAFQQLAGNGNSANFNNIINRISKRPKSITSTVPISDGKSEGFPKNMRDISEKTLKKRKNELTNSWWSYGGTQIRIFSLFLAWWRGLDVQKQQQPKQCECGGNFDCVPLKMCSPITEMPTVPTPTNEIRANHELSTHPVRHVAETFTPQRKITLELMQQTDSSEWKADGTNDRKRKKKRMKLFRLRHELHVGCGPNQVFSAELHFTGRRLLQQNFNQSLLLCGSNLWRHLLNNTSWIISLNESAIETKQTTQELENKQQTEVASQRSPPKGIEPQSPVTATKHFQEGHTGKEPVPFLNRTNSWPTEHPRVKKVHKSTLIGVSNIPFLRITNPHIDGRLVRVEQANELYLPLKLQ